MVSVAVPFAPDRTRIDDPAERANVAAFLGAGTVLLFTTATEVDRLEPARGAVVRLSVRTDGVWAWSDAVTYYVAMHGLAPDDGLYAHIRACAYRCTPADGPTCDRVIDELRSARR
jgi:hypothetical protein